MIGSGELKLRTRASRLIHAVLVYPAPRPLFYAARMDRIACCATRGMIRLVGTKTSLCCRATPDRRGTYPAQDFGRADRSCFSLRKHTFASLQLSRRIVARLSIEFRSSFEASMYDCSEERTAGLDGSLSHVGSYLIRGSASASSSRSRSEHVVFE